MSGSNPIVFVMVGIPGSGKSTIKEKLSAKYFVSTDWWVEDLANRLGKTYNEAFNEVIAQATNEMNKDIDFCIERNTSFTWDQTNLTKKKRRSILNRIPNHYIKVAVFVNTVLEVALDRNANRDRSINPSIIEDMYNRIEAPTLDEGFDHVMVFGSRGQLEAYHRYENDVEIVDKFYSNIIIPTRESVNYRGNI